MKKKALEAEIDKTLGQASEVYEIIEAEGKPPEVIRAIISRGLAECLGEAGIDKGYAPLRLLPAGLDLIRAGGYSGLRKKRRRERFSGGALWVVDRLLGLFGL